MGVQIIVPRAFFFSSSDNVSSSELEKPFSYNPPSLFEKSIAGMEATVAALKKSQHAFEEPQASLPVQAYSSNDQVYTALLAIEEDLRNVKSYVASNMTSKPEPVSERDGLNLSFIHGCANSRNGDNAFDKDSMSSAPEPDEFSTAENKEADIDLYMRWKSRLDSNINNLHRSNQHTLDRFKNEVYGSGMSLASSAGSYSVGTGRQFPSANVYSSRSSNIQWGRRTPFTSLRGSGGSASSTNYPVTGESRLKPWSSERANSGAQLKEHVNWLKEFRNKADLNSATSV